MKTPRATIRLVDTIVHVTVVTMVTELTVLVSVYKSFFFLLPASWSPNIDHGSILFINDGLGFVQ